MSSVHTGLRRNDTIAPDTHGIGSKKPETKEEVKEEIKARNDAERQARIETALAHIRAAEKKRLESEEARHLARLSATGSSLDPRTLCGRIQGPDFRSSGDGLRRSDRAEYLFSTQWPLVKFWKPPAAGAPSPLRRTDSWEARCMMHELERRGLAPVTYLA